MYNIDSEIVLSAIRSIKPNEPIAPTQLQNIKHYFSEENDDNAFAYTPILEALFELLKSGWSRFYEITKQQESITIDIIENRDDLINCYAPLDSKSGFLQAFFSTLDASAGNEKNYSVFFKLAQSTNACVALINFLNGILLDLMQHDYFWNAFYAMTLDQNSVSCLFFHNADSSNKCNH